MSATSSAHAAHAPVSFSSGAAAAYQVSLLARPRAPCPENARQCKSPVFPVAA